MGPDPWSEIYLTSTLLVWLVASFRDDVARRCAELLLVWFIMANAAYEYGEIETFPTILVASIYVCLCIVFIQIYRHWLPVYLCGSGIAMILWSFAYTDPSAYTYKAVKNAIYIGELLAVLIGCIRWRIPDGKS